MSATLGRIGWLERRFVIVILLAALGLRARDLFAPFDREFEGAQAAFFAIGAVNYERLGWFGAGGYPVVNIDLGQRGDTNRDLRLHPESWYVYANHPPLVPLLAWSAIRAGAPRDWSKPTDENRAPVGIEPWIRAPFLAASLLGLLALWWATREAAGPRRAMLTLAIAAALPISLIYGTLVNYENPSLLCIVVAAGFYARWIRDSKRSSLAACALAFAAGGAVTYSALFFIPPLALHACFRAGWRRAVWFVACGGLIGFAPIAAQAVWSSFAQQRLGLEPQGLLDRARELWKPLIDGSHPVGEWVGLQIERIGAWFTWPIAVAAALGLVLSLTAALRRCRKTVDPADHETRLDLEPAMLAGAALFLFASYRHTLDPQFTFLILLVPAVAGLAALALDRAANLLEKPRAALVSLVLIVGALVVYAVDRANDFRFDFRSRREESRDGRDRPRLPMPDVSGKEIATLVPPGGFGIHPAGVGLNLAVSFYAWRSLWPATGPSDNLPMAVAQRFGLGAAPHVLLLPKRPWPSIAADVSDLEHAWVKDLAPDRESEHWRAWDLH